MLRGTVRDEHGEPLKNANVRVFAHALSPSFLGMGQYDDPSVFGSPLALTDAEGRYSLEDLWPGEVHAYASPARQEDSFAPEFRAEAVLYPRSDQILEWNPVLAPGRTIRGRVLFSDGAPMSQVFVSALDHGADEGGSITLYTDDAGRFAFYNLPHGPFRVSVQLFGPPAGSAPLVAEEVWPDGPELELVTGFPSEAEARSTVRGRFLDPEGRLGDALSAVLESERHVQHFPDATAGGSFEFRWLGAGRYRVLGVRADTVVLVGEEFDLARGEELDLGALAVPPSATLTLRLARAGGMKTVQVGGSLYLRGTMLGPPLRFDAGNELALELSQGTYQLRLWAEGAAYIQREIELHGDAELELPVVPGVARALEIHLPSSGARGDLRVTVKDEAGVCYQDTTYVRGWNERSPFELDLRLPVGRFTVEAHTSSGLKGRCEFAVGQPGTAAGPAALALE